MLSRANLKKGFAFCHILLSIKLIYGDTLQIFQLSSVLSVTANLAKDYTAISSNVGQSSIHLAKIKKAFFLAETSFYCLWSALVKELPTNSFLLLHLLKSLLKIFRQTLFFVHNWVEGVCSTEAKSRQEFLSFSLLLF